MVEYVYMFEFRIIDVNMYQGPEYVSYNTYCEVTLQINEYLLRDKRIHNPFKDLRWSALEK